MTSKVLTMVLLFVVSGKRSELIQMWREDVVAAAVARRPATFPFPHFSSQRRAATVASPQRSFA